MPKLPLTLVFVFAAAACGGGTGAANGPTSPTATTPPAIPTVAFSLSGLVSDSTATSRYADGIPEATITITDGPNAGRSVEGDASGHYSMSGLQPGTYTITASFKQDAGYFTGPVTWAFPFVPQSKVITLSTNQLTLNQTLDFSLEEQCFYQFADADNPVLALPLPRARHWTAPGFPVVQVSRRRFIVDKIWGDASCRWTFASSEPWVTLTPVSSGRGGESVELNVPLSPVPIRCASTVLYTAIQQNGVSPRYHRVDIFSFGFNNNGDVNFCESYYSQF